MRLKKTMLLLDFAFCLAGIILLTWGAVPDFWRWLAAAFCLGATYAIYGHVMYQKGIGAGRAEAVKVATRLFRRYPKLDGEMEEEQ